MYERSNKATVLLFQHPQLLLLQSLTSPWYWMLVANLEKSMNSLQPMLLNCV